MGSLETKICDKAFLKSDDHHVHTHLSGKHAGFLFFRSSIICTRYSMYRTLRTGFLFSGIHCFCNTIQTLPNLEIFEEKRCTNSRVTFIIHTNIIFVLLRKVCHIKLNITTISKSSEKSTPSDQGLS